MFLIRTLIFTLPLIDIIMEFKNPFESDTQRYRDLIREDSKLPDEVDYEEITDDDCNQAVNNFMNQHSQSGFSDEAFRQIQKARDKIAVTKENQKKVSDMFGKLFNDLNQKYGLEIRFDFNSLSNSLEYIISPTNKRALELYLSEAYGRFRVVLYNQYLQAIAALSAQILDPDYLLSESMSYDAKLATMEKLFNFIQSMNQIYEQVNVSDTDMKLEKLSEDKNKVGQVNINDPEVRKFLEGLSAEVKSQE